MKEELEYLHEISRDKVSDHIQKDRSEIIRKIVNDNMIGYLLRRSPEEQEAYHEKYERHIDIITDYLTKNCGTGIDLEVVKGLHKHLYHGIEKLPLKTLGGVIEGSYMYPGTFREKDVHIRSVLNISNFIRFADPKEVPVLIDDLLHVTNDGTIDVFERYFRFIAEFVGFIHPFHDSNGKTAYMLGDIFLLDNGIQPFFIGDYISKNSGRAYKIFEKYKISQDKDLDGFYDLGVRMYRSLG